VKDLEALYTKKELEKDSELEVLKAANKQMEQNLQIVAQIKAKLFA